MPSTFSPSLRLELIGAGEQAGTWNTTTNTNLGTLLDQAIAGYTIVSVTSANQAFTALDGAADESRNAVIELTTTTTANFAVYAPPQEKTYIIYNNTAYTATIYNSTVQGNTTAAGTGVTVAAGNKTMVFTNATNFSSLSVPAPGTGTVTSVGTSGNVNGITLTGGPITTTGTLTLGGTLSNVNLSSQVTSTLPVANGGTGQTSLAAAGIITTAGGQTIAGNLTSTATITALNLSAGSTLSAVNVTASATVSAANVTASNNITAVGGTFSGSLSGLNVTAGNNLFCGAGSLFVNTFSTLGIYPAAVNISYLAASEAGIVTQAFDATNQNAMLFLNYLGTPVGSIFVTPTNTTFNDLSDYRLKNSIVPMTGALAKVALLKPCTYKWNIDGSDGQGFIAHELQAVVPQAATGEKDAVTKDGTIKPQGIDPSKLVATLTAAIQELKALVDAQAARITALESR